MIKVSLILKDDNLKKVLENKIKLLLNSNSKEVYFVQESYVKDAISDEILILFFEINNNNDIKIAKELREYNHSSSIIFLSRDESLVFESLRVNPLQFIRLNTFNEDFNSMAETLLDYIKNIDTIITLKSGTATIRLNVNNIMFIESFGHYLIIHSTTGEYKIRGKLSTIIERINNPCFIRVHKSYIININFTEKVLSDRLKLKNNLEIPVGRSFKEEVAKEIVSLKSNPSY
jgi:two-component system response regulator LytT